MSLHHRIKFDLNQVSLLEFHQETCFKCKYWVHRVRKDSRYCHKCINNVNLPISSNGMGGYNLVGLRDYFDHVKPDKAKVNSL